MVLYKGQWQADEPVLVEVHSSCVTGDIFGSCRCDCGLQLHNALRMVEKKVRCGSLYESRRWGIGLINKLKAYKQESEWIQ